MTAQLLKDLSLFGPEVALTVTMLVAIIADLIARRSTALVPAIVSAGLVITGSLVIAQTGAHASVFSNMVAVDAFAVYFKLVIVLCALLIVVFSLGSKELLTSGRRLGEYYALLVALTLGMMLMAGASNLLMMYLSIELSSITSYILTGYTRDAQDSSEASLPVPRASRPMVATRPRIRSTSRHASAW